MAFSRKYNAKVAAASRGGDGKDGSMEDGGEVSVMERRRKALLLHGNVDRVEDVLELPALLATAISSSSSSSSSAAAVLDSQQQQQQRKGSSMSTPGIGGGGGGSSSNLMNYASALDLQAHAKRLHALYPDIRLIDSITQDVELEMKRMTSNLISGLQTPNLKLAGAMRSVGWLRRVAPELTSPWNTPGVERKSGNGIAPGLKNPIARSTAATSTTSTTNAKSRSHMATSSTPVESENALSTLFLACRLANLNKQLSALEPFRELAEQEEEGAIELEEEEEGKNSTANEERRGPPRQPDATSKRKTKTTGMPKANISAKSTISGQHTERYLKKYIEIFREHSFSIVSMHKSIFPAELAVVPSVDSIQNSSKKDRKKNENDDKSKGSGEDFNDEDTNDDSGNDSGNDSDDDDDQDPFLPVPSPLATFVLHLSSLLSETLTRYLPNVRDKAARDSLLTQVLYCAGSLGRLGSDFGMMIALLDEEGGSTDEGSTEEGMNVENGGHVKGDEVQEEQEREEEEDGGDKEEPNEPWAEVMKRQRMQASRLELLASGVSGGTSSGGDSRMANVGSKKIIAQATA